MILAAQAVSNMILQSELDQLTEDELGLLQYIVTKEGTNTTYLEFIKCTNKEYIAYYISRNMQKLNDIGRPIAVSLMKKLINVEIK